jgi:hypothetical protein
MDPNNMLMFIQRRTSMAGLAEPFRQEWGTEEEQWKR